MPLCSSHLPGRWVPVGDGRIGVAGYLMDPGLAPAERVAALRRLFRPRPGQHIDVEPLEVEQAREISAALASPLIGLEDRVAFEADATETVGCEESWLEGLSKSTRRGWLRSRKMIETAPEFRRVTDEDGHTVATEAFIAATAKSWKTANGTGFGGSDAGLVFLRHLAMHAPKGYLKLEAVFDGDTAICGAFGIASAGKLYGIAADFSEDYAKTGAGRYMLIRWVIRSFADPNLVMTDHTRTCDANRAISTTTRHLHRITIWNRADPSAALRFMPSVLRRINKARRSGASVRAAALSKSKEA